MRRPETNSSASVSRNGRRGPSARGRLDTRPDTHLQERTVRGRRTRHGNPHRTAEPRGARRARHLVASRELPVGGTDLPDGQPPLARAVASRAHQAPAARTLGHHPGTELRLRPPQPRDHRPRPRDDVCDGSRARRARTGRRGLARGHLQRGLSGHLPGCGRHGAAVHPVLVPRGDSQPRRPRDTRIHPRGRGARVRPVARLRGRFRQPGPHRRCRGGRRRGRDRAPRHQLALHEVRRPAPGRRRAADPAPERVQDRQPDRPRPHRPRRARAPAPRLRPRSGVRRGLRPRAHAPGVRGGPGPLPRCDPRDPAPRTPRRCLRATALADDRAAFSQGLDRTEGGRRSAGRRVLALAPGALRQCPRRRRPPQDPRGVAA